MRVVKGIGQFWYDFVIGDDWKIAAAIFTTVGLAAVVASVSSSSWLAPLAGIGLALAFVLSLVADLRH